MAGNYSSGNAERLGGPDNDEEKIGMNKGIDIPSPPQSMIPKELIKLERQALNKFHIDISQYRDKFFLVSHQSMGAAMAQWFVVQI